jgi:hypothetical protein
MMMVTALLAFTVAVHVVGVSAYMNSWGLESSIINCQDSPILISQGLDAVPASVDHGLSMEHIKVYNVLNNSLHMDTVSLIPVS